MASQEEESKTPEAAEEVAAAPEEESTATFEPVVQLEEVEVVSGEEGETVIYSQRAKLYVFGETMLNKGTGVQTWNERGIGDVKILQDNEDQTIRLLMRQEKTMKCIANFKVDPRIELNPNAGTDRAWMWHAYDFSGGEELELTKFSVKFRDSDIANAFKKAFEEAMETMKPLVAAELAAAAEAAPTASKENDAAADEVAEQLASLTTSDEK